MPVEALEDPVLAERATWLTDWAKLEDPVSVPHSYEYFVDNVDEDKLQAKLDLFQWLADSGTPVNATVTVRPGSVIGGKRRTFVLRPAKQTFEMENVEFETQDILVDVSASAAIDPAEHPDLELPEQKDGYALPSEILVLDKFRELTAVNSRMNLARRRMVEANHKLMAKVNQELKPVRSDDDVTEGYEAIFDGADFQEGQRGGGRRGRDRDRRRKN